MAGRRSEYRPIRSRLTASSEPVEVAKAIRDRFHLLDYYLADLDAIAGAPPAFALYDALQNLGLRLWVDAGVHEPARARALAEFRLDTVVLGLETVDGPEVLQTVCGRLGAERLLFSLDLKDGQPLGKLAAWQTPAARAIAGQAVAAGIKRLLVLDLARVGGMAGTGTETLCRELAHNYPDVQLVTGGGVRRREDLVRLQACGVQAVLIASALHDQSLRPADWADL
jgi:phosphoribosylformimino-5-aminoimidazole carboxamide ribotide isomerase